MQQFFEPRSVVLIGTSRQTGPGAYNNLEMLLSYGYPGRIHLVHPKVPDIMGYKTCPRVARSSIRIRRSSVLLPAPEWPVRKAISPGPRRKLTSCRAAIPPA